MISTCPRVSACALVVLRKVVLAERLDDHGAYSLDGVGKAPLIICTSLLDLIAEDESIVRAAVAELRAAGLLDEAGVRVQPHARGRLGLASDDDLDDDGQDMRTAVVRLVASGPRREADIAAALGGRTGHLKRVLARMYQGGLMAPASSLWSTEAGRKLVEGAA